MTDLDAGARRRLSVRIDKPPLRARFLIPGLIGAALLVLLVAPVIIVTLAGHRVATSVVPAYSNTLAKVQGAERMRPYMLPPDTSIAPLRAGEAQVSLGARENTKVDSVTRRAARGPYSLPSPDPTLFPDARPVEWKGPQSTKIIPASRRGFTRAEMDYLRSLAENPVWDEHAIVARAPRMDLAGAFYRMPFPDRFSPVDLPIMKFAATKEIAYANVSRAAYHLANRHADSAEMVLRETISNGFRLIDDGNSLIDDLIGVTIVGIGRTALEQFYEVTKNPKLDSLRADSAAGPVNAPGITPGDDESWARAMTDTTLPRGLRLELVTAANLATCTSFGGLMRGRSGTLDDAMTTARTHLVRTPAEGDLFDLNAHVVDRPSTLAYGGAEPSFATKIIVFWTRLPAMLLRNPRLVNCAGAALGGLAR